MHTQSDEPRRILIVEDDEATREAFALILGQDGFKVETASNGLTALEQLRSSVRPDLILLDLMMPVMDGTQLQEHLARDDELADIPVLICSAAGERARRQPHAVGYLNKPVDPPVLLAAVRHYC
jgi:twitching motility two-component system response regulator PilH